MLDKLFSLSGISGLLAFAGFVPYIVAILRKKTKPAKASWIIWSSVDAVLLAGMWVKHSVNGQIIGSLVGATIVAVLSFKFGKPGWTWTDKVCLGGMMLGIALWQIFDSPVTGIVISSAIIVIGMVPTATAAWKDPSCEDRLGWTLFWVSCLFALGAIPVWDLANAAQPISFTLNETAMMYILYIRAAALKLEAA